METAEKILKKQEVHQIYINGTVYEMVKLSQAIKAVEEYHNQFEDKSKKLEKLKNG